jgi:uncharacterized membrane protein
VQIFLPVHITSAGVGIISGAIALCLAKGQAWHRKIGLVFVYSMLGMSLSAVVIAIAKGQVMNIVAGLLTAYLVVTALMTVRPFSPGANPVHRALLVLALLLGLTTTVFAFQALAYGQKYGLPAFPFFMFAAVGLLASAGDWRMIRSGGYTGAKRLSRHLWRMCWALFIAVASFFSIRSRVARVLPAPFTTPTMRVLPVLLVIVSMLYWLWRVRRKKPLRGVALARPHVPRVSLSS